MTQPAHAIPRYGLYGEALSANAGEIIHCETIETRSRLYRWEISAHRHPAQWQVLFLASGTAQVTLSGTISSAEGPVAIIAPAGTVHGFRFSEGAVGFVTTLSQEFIGQLAAEDVLAAALAAPAIVTLDQATKRRLLVLGRQLLEAAPTAGGSDQRPLQRALAEAWLRIAISPLTQPAPRSDRSRLRDFQTLVERHYREHRPLAFYARELGCTERTLARLTQQALDVTPGQFIHGRIMVEARRLLRFTNASCSQAAAELGFEDPSYFSRFYLRMTGRRPSEEKG